MGASHVTDYARSLQFVQTLNDDAFGEIDVYRNEEGKFIMKCSKSFITGDKRHSDFIKTLEFIRTSNNPNIIPVLYLQQSEKSNVCISYEKMELYSEYLNFTLEGLIRNKKSIEDGEIWYLMRTMLGLIGELERERMKMMFSLNNIFLTLKGIPSVFLYHFLIDNNNPQSSTTNNPPSNPLFHYQHQNPHHSSPLKSSNYLIVQSNQQQQIIHHPEDKYYLNLKPYSMHYCLGKIVLQLYNMKMITEDGDLEEIKQVNGMLEFVDKQNKKLSAFVRCLMTNADTQKLIYQITQLQQTNQIKLSTEIRFNKFRYIMTEEQKPSKNLTLTDNNIVDLTSKPITPIHTPIYRLRDNYNLQQSTEKDFSIKSKLLVEQQQFFKKKTIQNQKNATQNHMEFMNAKKRKTQEWYKSFTTQKVQQRSKANSIAGKVTPKVEGQINGRKTNLERGSKLSLVGKSKNLSASKVQNKRQISGSYCSLNDDMNKMQNFHNKSQLNLALSRQFHSHQFIPDNNHSFNLPTENPSISISNNSNVMNEKGFKQLKSTKRITQILNEEINKNRKKTINNKQNTLLNGKYDEQQSYQLKSNHNTKLYEFFNSQNSKPKSLSYHQSQFRKQQAQKFEHNNKVNQLDKQKRNPQSQKQATPSQSHKQYKPQHIEISAERQQCQNSHQITVDNIVSSPFGKVCKMNESINALDRANFLLTLQLKKSKNTLRVKQLVQKKDSIISQLTTQKPTNINPNPNNNVSKIPNSTKPSLPQTIPNTSITSFEKKKIRLKNDKQQNSIHIHQKSPIRCKDKDQNKQNKVDNIDEIWRSSKLRKVNMRERQQPLLK